MPESQRRRVVVVSPHTGDAALALGLAIQRWLQLGCAVHVISCFTRTEWGPYTDAASLHPNDRMSFVSAARRREDQLWRRACRNPRLTEVDLNLKDAPLRLHCSADEVWGLEARREDPALAKALGKLDRAIEQARPDVLLLPLALRGHIDHRTARAVAATWLPRTAVAFYPELPEALGLPEYDLAALIAAEVQLIAADLHTDLQLQIVAAAGPEAAHAKQRIAVEFDSQLTPAQVDEIAAAAAQHGERVWATPQWPLADQLTS